MWRNIPDILKPQSAKRYHQLQSRIAGKSCENVPSFSAHVDGPPCMTYHFQSSFSYFHVQKQMILSECYQIVCL